MNAKRQATQLKPGMKVRLPWIPGWHRIREVVKRSITVDLVFDPPYADLADDGNMIRPRTVPDEVETLPINAALLVHDSTLERS